MRVICWRAFAAAAALAALLVSPAVGETIESVTTPFDADKCAHKAGHAAEDDGEWHCVGYAGIPIVMTAGDVRVYVSYGAKAAREPAAAQTLAAPNGEGKSIEWRIVREPGRKGRAFATIMRWSTAVPVDDPKIENGTYRGEMLVVTRLGPGGVCHVGYVDARQNANATGLAREIADRHARTFRCGKDKPIVFGDKGPGFSGPYGAND
jgi:hypothetical protein